MRGLARRSPVGRACARGARRPEGAAGLGGRRYRWFCSCCRRRGSEPRLPARSRFAPQQLSRPGPRPLPGAPLLRPCPGPDAARRAPPAVAPLRRDRGRVPAAG